MHETLQVAVFRALCPPAVCEPVRLTCAASRKNQSCPHSSTTSTQNALDASNLPDMAAAFSACSAVSVAQYAAIRQTAPHDSCRHDEHDTRIRLRIVYPRAGRRPKVGRTAHLNRSVSSGTSVTRGPLGTRLNEPAANHHGSCKIRLGAVEFHVTIQHNKCCVFV